MTQHAEVIKLLHDEIRTLDYMSTPTPNVVTEHFAKENIAKAVKIHAAIDVLQAAQAQTAAEPPVAIATARLHGDGRWLLNHGAKVETGMELYASPPEHTTEIERLTKCLKKANSNHEEFERLWYLATDKSDSQKASIRLALAMLHFMNDNGYRLEEYEQGRMDAAIAALEELLT